MISVAALIQGGIGPTQARLFAPWLVQVCERFDISTPLRQAAFLGQCAHESGGFVHLEESLRWRDPVRLDAFFSAVKGVEHAKQLISAGPEAIANVVYAGRNGNSRPGDGWLYRGRGLIQLTGRTNYTTADLKLHEPYIEQPDLVAQPDGAALTAGFFWDQHACNRLADLRDFDAITRAVNGAAMAGKDERTRLTRDFLAILSLPA